MSISPGLAIWKTAFELSPIVLVNGLVEAFPGGVLPIVALTEALNFPLGILSGTSQLDLNDFFAHFRPLPGATLIDQEIGRYPFATQAVAANATIAQPLLVSMEMVAPARGILGYPARLALMTAVQKALQFHNSNGGTFHVATPSFIYTNCILKTLRDTSGGGTNQPQHTWQWDFEKPLITLDDATAAQNGLMSWISRQTQLTNPAWSGFGQAVGSPITVAGPATIPAAAGPGAGTFGIPSGAAGGPLSGGGI